MLIGGFQKLTLIDYPGKMASIVFTQGCLFRCPFCHNPELIFAREDGEYISESIVLEYLASHKDMLDGVVITGGEPTLHRDLGSFIRKIHDLGLSIKLDTNGVHPEMVEDYIREGLIDYVAMDLKHTWEKYQTIANTKNEDVLKECRTTFDLLQNSGVKHEFRTTVLPGWHKEEDFQVIAGYLKPGSIYYIQDISYEKTLDKELNKKKRINVKKVVDDLQVSYPELTIGIR